MIDFLQHYGEAIITMTIIITLIFLPWEKIFKETNYNGKGMFEEGYTKAENEIKKGKDATLGDVAKKYTELLRLLQVRKAQNQL